MKAKCLFILEKIISDYPQYYFIKSGNDNRCSCFLKEKIIILRKNIEVNITNDDLFDVLHEVGHLQTNTLRMKLYEKEYYATEWAIQKAPIYNIIISQSRKKVYDEYIENYRQISIKHCGKNVWSKEKCKLHWD